MTIAERVIGEHRTSSARIGRGCSRRRGAPVAPSSPVALPTALSSSSPLRPPAMRRSRTSAPTAGAWWAVTTYPSMWTSEDRPHAFSAPSLQPKSIPRRSGQGCRQTLNLSVAEGGLAVVMPDPIVCFNDAQFTQRQRFDLDPSAGLVLVDTLSSGRRARGERWAMHHYESRNDIYVNGRARLPRCPAARSPRRRPLWSSPHGPVRLHRHDCVGRCATEAARSTHFRASFRRVMSAQTRPDLSPPVRFPTDCSFV